MKFIKKGDLGQRIADLKAECEAFVLAYAEKEKLGGGLPIEVHLQILNRGNQVETALHVLALQKRDALILEEQALAQRLSTPAA